MAFPRKKSSIKNQNGPGQKKKNCPLPSFFLPCSASAALLYRTVTADASIPRPTAPSPGCEQPPTTRCRHRCSCSSSSPGYRNPLKSLALISSGYGHWRNSCRRFRALQKDVPFRRKVVYTAGSLVVFFAGSQLRLYGVDTTMAADDPLFWAHTAYAGNFGTVMSLGVFPLVVLEMATHILLGLRAVNPTVENRIILNGLQKLLGVLISVVMPVGIALSVTHLGMGSAILASLQISVGSIVVIYIDEVLRKGYGLLSAIPLFTTANICATIFWKALRAGVHGKLGETFAFFLLVLNLQGYRVPLPVRRRPRSPDQETRFQTNHYINISYLAYAPILFQATIVSSTYLFSQHLYMDFGENKLVNLLGKWQRSKGFGGFIPVGGIAYYLTTPPTLADVARDPVHACLYAALLLFGCGLVSMAWFRVCIHSRPYMNWLIGDQVSVTPVQDDSIPLSQWARRVFMVAFAVGFCVGALTLLAGFMGVIGSGTGIMLAVTVMHSYFDSGASSGIGPIGL